VLQSGRARNRCRETAIDTSTPVDDTSTLFIRSRRRKSLLHVYFVYVSCIIIIIGISALWPAQIDHDGPFFIYGFRPGMLILFSQRRAMVQYMPGAYLIASNFPKPLIL
jgi:hypothetical protein